jgi:hypothetical protein
MSSRKSRKSKKRQPGAVERRGRPKLAEKRMPVHLPLLTGEYARCKEAALSVGKPFATWARDILLVASGDPSFRRLLPFTAEELVKLDEAAAALGMTFAPWAMRNLLAFAEKQLERARLAKSGSYGADGSEG